MYELMTRLFPICRSITGDGTRETLRILQETLPDLNIHEVPTGTKVFDWEVPKEWNVRDAYILDPDGNKVVDFRQNNLHLVGYSTPIDQVISLEDLQQHLYSLEEQPEAIPYITSYYKERWGFCLTHNQRKVLRKGNYHVYIDSKLEKGHLTYGELIIPGSSEREVFISTYICHPSMANNELSGPVVTASLAAWIASTPRRYTYRIVFIPETIGSITYLSRNLDVMKSNVVAGFNVTCVGDDRTYSFMPSRYGNTLADKTALHILRQKHTDFVQYSYLQRGSDERQYCSPGVDLPMVSIMRTKYGMYPEYHTSLDNLSLVSPQGLKGSFDVHQDCIKLLEKNYTYRINCLGEPQLGKRGLYPTLSTKESGVIVRDMMNFIAYADGTNDLVDISNLIGTPVQKLYPIVDNLVGNGLLSRVE
ncbi:aminopeptidase [Paenibacillus sp. FSL R7-0337]|nr:aminopeptidase [Paenibacillus sp. FSL R7-0337]